MHKMFFQPKTLYLPFHHILFTQKRSEMKNKKRQKNERKKTRTKDMNAWHAVHGMVADDVAFERLQTRTGPAIVDRWISILAPHHITPTF